MHFVKLNNCKCSKIYKVLIENDDDNLPSLTIIDKENSYSCKVSQEDVDKFASLLEIESSRYLEQLKKLLNNDATAVDINNSQLHVFMNKKTKYFIRRIEEINHVEALHKCLDFMFEQNAENAKENDDLITNRSDLAKELQNCKDQLDKSIAAAQERESRLYSCFIQLLNEKKKYIRHLRHFIDAKDLEKIESKQKSEMNSCDSDTNVSDTDVEDNDDVTTEGNATEVVEKIEAGPSNIQAAKTIKKRLTLDDTLIADDSSSTAKKLCLRPYKSLPNEANIEKSQESSISSSQSTQIVNYSTQDLLDTI